MLFDVIQSTEYQLIQKACPVFTLQKGGRQHLKLNETKKIFSHFLDDQNIQNKFAPYEELFIYLKDIQ